MFERPVIALVSGGVHTPASSSLLRSIAAAARAGIDLVQIREGHLDDRALVELTRQAVVAVGGTAARVLVNGRPDIALAAGAAGVHLPGTALPAPRVRSIVPSGFVIGRSVHTVEEASDAESAGGCDYLVFGTVYPSTSKPAGQPVAGLVGLAAVCARVRLPVLAIGGMAVDRIRPVALAGAAGLAAISLFADSADLALTVRSVRAAFDT